MLHPNFGRNKGGSEDVLSQIQRENHVGKRSDNFWIKFFGMLEPAPVDKGHAFMLALLLAIFLRNEN